MTETNTLAERLRDMPEVSTVSADDAEEPPTLDVALATSDITDDVDTAITAHGGRITNVDANGSFTLHVEVPGELRDAGQYPVRTQGRGCHVVTIPGDAVELAGFTIGDDLAVGAREGSMRLSSDPEFGRWLFAGDRRLRSQSQSYIITLPPDALDSAGFSLGDVLKFRAREDEIRLERVATQCPVCGDRFDSRLGMQTHMGKAHPNVDADDDAA